MQTLKLCFMLYLIWHKLKTVSLPLLFFSRLLTSAYSEGDRYAHQGATSMTSPWELQEHRGFKKCHNFPNVSNIVAS